MKLKAKLINIDENLDLAVKEAVNCYNSEDVFIYPTDTVYGFGCNRFSESASDKINVIKQRRESKQFILLIDSLDTLLNYVVLSEKKQVELLRKIWPNPVSVIFELKDDKKKIFKSKTAAFRIPNHKFCLRLLSILKAPLVSTSVNLMDEPPLNDHLTIIDKFSDAVSAIFYTNFEKNEEPSSLINFSGEKPRIIRKGSIKFVDLFGKLL